MEDTTNYRQKLGLYAAYGRRKSCGTEDKGEKGTLSYKDICYDQKRAHLTPEEQELRRENLEARKSYSDEGIHRLMCAVCTQAVKSYRDQYKMMQKAGTPDKKTGEMKICEDFFDSDIFQETVPGLEANEIIEKIKKSVDTISDSELEKMCKTYIVSDAKRKKDKEDGYC